MLTRPISVLLQIAANSFRLNRIGGLIQGLAILTIALFKISPLLNLYNFYLIILVLLSLTIIYYALSLTSGSFSIWSLESIEIFNAFTFGGVEVTKYPLSIYPKWLQSLFMYFIPLGMASFLPSAHLLAKPLDLDIWAPPVWGVPIFAGIFLWLAWCFWHFSLKHYQSAG